VPDFFKDFAQLTNSRLRKLNNRVKHLVRHYEHQIHPNAELYAGRHVIGAILASL
jgi:hypothetical protein